MIVGAAVLPTAPLLVPGVSPTLPEGVEKVRGCVDAAVAALPPCDLIVVVAAGDGGIHDTATVSFAGIGREDLSTQVPVAATEVAALRRALGGLGTADGAASGAASGALPLDLSVLALHVAGVARVVPVAVPPDAPFGQLADTGSVIAQTFAGPDVRAAVVVAGDLSAGLTEKSPLHLVSGAIFWDEQAVAAVDGGRMEALGRLGPQEAARVGARGWAALSVLAGVTGATRFGMVVRHYSAPRGVGYMVASGG